MSQPQLPKTSALELRTPFARAQTMKSAPGVDALHHHEDPKADERPTDNWGHNVHSLDQPRAGERVTLAHLPGVDRYLFDFDRCHPALGWVQWDTVLDGRHFGIWVHPARREIITFARDRMTRVRCSNAAQLGRRLEAMEAFYGPPPPIAIARHDSGAVETLLGSRIFPDFVRHLQD